MQPTHTTENPVSWTWKEDFVKQNSSRVVHTFGNMCRQSTHTQQFNKMLTGHHSNKLSTTELQVAREAHHFCSEPNTPFPTLIKSSLLLHLPFQTETKSKVGVETACRNPQAPVKWMQRINIKDTSGQPLPCLAKQLFPAGHFWVRSHLFFLFTKPGIDKE